MSKSDKVNVCNKERKQKKNRMQGKYSARHLPMTE